MIPQSPAEISPTPDPEPPSLGTIAGRLIDRLIAPRVTATGLVLAVVMGIQAIWLGVLSSRGWFYQDDFHFIVQALHQPLSWHYLSENTGNHLSPGLRLFFWVISRTTRLHYVPTILLRLVLQMVATALLYRLLVRLSASKRASLVVTTAYCFSPMLIPGTLYLTSAVNLLPAQIAALLAYHLHLNHVRTGSLRRAFGCGLALLVAASFWEKTAVDTVAVLVLLDVGWLTTGRWTARLRTLLRDWFGWVLSLVPLAAFGAYYVAGGYGASAKTSLSPATGLRLIALDWYRALWPAVVGAPWHWFATPTQFASAADPGIVAIVIGQLVFLALAGLSWRRHGLAGGLLIWTLPLVAVAVGSILVGLGRYVYLGDLAVLDFHYVYDLALPTAIAAALCLRPSERPPVRFRYGERGLVRLTTALRSWFAANVPRRFGPEPAFAAAVVVLLVVSSGVSALLWTARWHASPAKSYVTQLVANVRFVGPNAPVYDVAVPVDVMPLLEPDKYVSSLLLAAGVPLVSQGNPPTLVPDAGGHLVAAHFEPSASLVMTPNPVCPSLITGRASRTFRLSKPLVALEYVVRIDYYQPGPSQLDVTVRDAAGRSIDTSGGRLALTQTLGEIDFPVDFGAPRTVTIAGTSTTTRVCIAKADLGIPTVTAAGSAG